MRVGGFLVSIGAIIITGILLVGVGVGIWLLVRWARRRRDARQHDIDGLRARVEELERQMRSPH